MNYAVELQSISENGPSNAARIYEELKPILKARAEKGFTSFAVGINCSEDVGGFLLGLLFNDGFNVSFDEKEQKIIIVWSAKKQEDAATTIPSNVDTVKNVVAEVIDEVQGEKQ